MFPSYDLLMTKENAQSIHWHCRKQSFGILLSSTTSNWSCLAPFSMKSPSRAVARCGSADYDSIMVHAWWCSTIFSSCNSGILEQRVSGTMVITRWTNSMARSFRCFKTLRFLSLGTSEVYCLCYRDQWCSEPVTTNTELISDDSYDTRHFPGGRQSLFRRETFCVEGHGRHCEKAVTR